MITAIGGSYDRNREPLTYYITKNAAPKLLWTNADLFSGGGTLDCPISCIMERENCFPSDSPEAIDGILCVWNLASLKGKAGGYDSPVVYMETTNTDTGEFEVWMR